MDSCGGRPEDGVLEHRGYRDREEIEAPGSELVDAFEDGPCDGEQGSFRAAHRGLT